VASESLFPDADDGAWLPLLAFAELPTDGAGKVVEAGDLRLAVFAIDGAPHVLDDTCPHEGASLGDGVVNAGEVTCPWHGWHFDLASGCNTDGLPECVRVYEARVRADGTVECARAPRDVRPAKFLASDPGVAASSPPPRA